MSATKKRPADQYVEDLKDSTMSRKEHRKASSPTSKFLLKNTAFVEQKKTLWQQHMERLNETTKDKLLNDPSITPNETFYTACEHLRVQEDIVNLYHRPPGEVVAMGMDDCFQLGVAISADAEKDTEYPPTLVRNLPSNVIQVAAGGLHSAALTEDGAVYTWGCNDDYALGRDGITDENLHFVKPIAQEQSFAPKDQGQIVGIDAGDSHTLFLSLHGNVYQVGMYKDVDSGKFRDLPPGETNCKGTNEVAVQVKIPGKVRAIAAGYSWNAAILADDSMVTWGMGHNGQLARSRDMGAPIIQTEDGKETFDLGKTWIGEEYDIEEKNEQGKMETVTLYRYHKSLIAEKFLKPQPPRWATPGKKRVLSIACGEIHLLVVARDEGTFDSVVYSSGQSQYGQLGHGDTEQRHELTPIEAFKGEQISKVAAGQQHSLALSIRGDAVFAWGRSDYGQLGLTSEKQSAGSFESTPKQVAFPKTVGDTRIKDIAVGPLLSMVIMDNNDVYSWGFAETGATGHLTGEDGADVVRPKKLEVLQKYSENQHQGTNCHVHNISGGGQHTLMVIKRFT